MKIRELQNSQRLKAKTLEVYRYLKIQPKINKQESFTTYFFIRFDKI